jgi:hypothetical protein
MSIKNGKGKMTAATMFSPKFVTRVRRVLRDTCKSDRGTTRLVLAKILANDFPGSTENEIVLALSILVPNHIPGYETRLGRGGGIVKVPE